MNLPVLERFDLIAVGLTALITHITKLYSDAKQLEALDRPRGAGIIEAFMLEESAKVLILLDLTRTNIQSDSDWVRQIGWFYDHLARCLYIRAYEGNPATLGEVRDFLNIFRDSHYLDGPNDVDWIFRNQLIAEREQTLYVDLVEAENELMWSEPNEIRGSFVSRRIPDLIVALARTGVTSRPGLDLVSATWGDVEIDDSMSWAEIRHLNQRIVSEAFENGLHDENELTQRDVNLVVNHWIFPLRSLDLSKVKVDIDELRAKRERIIRQRSYEEWC